MATPGIEPCPTAPEASTQPKKRGRKVGGSPAPHPLVVFLQLLGVGPLGCEEVGVVQPDGGGGGGLSTVRHPLWKRRWMRKVWQSLGLEDYFWSIMMKSQSWLQDHKVTIFLKICLSNIIGEIVVPLLHLTQWEHCRRENMT